jgi:hypothetical protein
MLQIEDEIRLVAGREGVAMNAGAFGGRQFGADVVVLEQDGVVAGLHALIGMIEARTIALLRRSAIARDEFCVSCTGHYKKVEEIAAACTAEVGMAEAHDRVI